MIIKDLHPKRSQTRYNADSFYQSAEWRKARKNHLSGSTTVTPEQFNKILQINPTLRYTNGTISNHFCLECYKEGRLKEGNQVDHITRIKEGGDRTDGKNLQTLCDPHHAKKSAKEGNQRHKK